MSLFLNLLFDIDSYSNAYFLAKFGFALQTSEQNLASIQLRTIPVTFACSPRTDPPGGREALALAAPAPRGPRLRGRAPEADQQLPRRQRCPRAPRGAEGPLGSTYLVHV